MIEWFMSLELWQMLGITLGALDIILGAIPDKYVKYPGALLSVAHQLHQYGKDVRQK
jgi:hypothetical protein